MLSVTTICTLANKCVPSRRKGEWNVVRCVENIFAIVDRRSNVPFIMGVDALFGSS